MWAVKTLYERIALGGCNGGNGLRWPASTVAKTNLIGDVVEFIFWTQRLFVFSDRTIQHIADADPVRDGAKALQLKYHHRPVGKRKRDARNRTEDFRFTSVATPTIYAGCSTADDNCPDKIEGKIYNVSLLKL
ncbi:hypothetical protein M8C21_027894 [Ambrosia artemisiifolia]|uniref:Uncharacterized protein n=1 Tax=Ambrosia artemisiifolia TaxID=4212 RepID=A0AAD5GM44_AMBAR|nr:hypothetical protein M8C21_027894 [Ambrosia artemisiifolia]